MSAYYLLLIDYKALAPMPQPYDRCAYYDTGRPRAVCPLCGRGVEGPAWLGPYEMWTNTPHLPELTFTWGFDTDGLLMSEAFLAEFRARGLTGIADIRPCTVYYRKRPIDRAFYIPTAAYSQKAVPFAAALNERRKTDKSLPRCSLCSGHTGDKDALYFDERKEFDLFRKYDNCTHTYCTDAFRRLCLDLRVPGMIFREVKG